MFSAITVLPTIAFLAGMYLFRKRGLLKRTAFSASLCLITALIMFDVVFTMSKFVPSTSSVMTCRLVARYDGVKPGSVSLFTEPGPTLKTVGAGIDAVSITISHQRSSERCISFSTKGYDAKACFGDANVRVFAGSPNTITVEASEKRVSRNRHGWLFDFFSFPGTATSEWTLPHGYVVHIPSAQKEGSVIPFPE